jgi:hypothetical protein
MLSHCCENELGYITPLSSIFISGARTRLKKVMPSWRKLTPSASTFLLFYQRGQHECAMMCRDIVLLLRMKEYYGFE